MMYFRIIVFSSIRKCLCPDCTDINLLCHLSLCMPLLCYWDICKTSYPRVIIFIHALFPQLPNNVSTEGLACLLPSSVLLTTVCTYPSNCRCIFRRFRSILHNRMPTLIYYNLQYVSDSGCCFVSIHKSNSTSISILA